MAVRAWHCAACREPLGTITHGNDLIVTMPGALMETTRTSVIIHCRCGKAMLWAGRRVIWNQRVLRQRAEPAKDTA